MRFSLYLRFPTLSDTVYCFEANCHGWKQDSFSHCCCLFGKSTYWALLSILTGWRLWASRFTLVSFTPPGRKCYLLSCFSHFPEGLLQGGQPLPKRCLDRVLRGTQAGLQCSHTSYRFKVREGNKGTSWMGGDKVTLVKGHAPRIGE